ncbi:MAG TPA: ATP-binding protein [Ignavibacteria bacterium]|jgi:predicted HTH transcriptional regulator
MRAEKTIFDQILEGLAETHRIDFKESCPWNVQTFVKDFLAFSNVEEGGYIVIGVKETGNVNNPFIAEGITIEHMATYNYDIMKDQIAPYADPHVNFTLIINQWNGKDFLFIKIEEFDDIPIICIRNNQNGDVHEGSIYFRSQKGRPNSKNVSSSYDLRDILERASYKFSQRRSKYEQSRVVEPMDLDKEKFDKERGLL